MCKICQVFRGVVKYISYIGYITDMYCVYLFQIVIRLIWYMSLKLMP